jgi:hypothetical protein
MTVFFGWIRMITLKILIELIFAKLLIFPKNIFIFQESVIGKEKVAKDYQ